MNIVYFQDSRIFRKGDKYFNAKDSHFFDRFTANLLPNEKLHIYMRQKRLSQEYDVSKLMEVPTDNISFHEMPSFWNPLNWFSIIKRIKNIIKNASFAYLRTEGIFGCIAGLFCLKYKKIYMSIMPADPEVGLKKHGILGYVIAIPHVRFVKKVVKNANYAYYVTDSYLQKKYPTKGYSLGCSDVQLANVSDEVLTKRLSKIDNNKKIIIGTAGALLPSIKGQDFVIKAITFLPNVDIQYQLIGLGSKDEIEKIANDLDVRNRINIIGTIPHDEVFTWLDEIDIYIQPSRTEGLPRALIEAMSRGLPCVGSNVGGIPELLPKECIFVPKNKDIPTLVKEIEFFCDKDNQRKYAIENFESAKRFKKETINKKQHTFFAEFDNYARSHSQD